MENKPENVKTFIINQTVCKKCGICKKACPAEAIEGKVKESFRINKDNCIRCGICFGKCKFQAIEQADMNEKDAFHCRKCGQPIDLPIYLYINKRTKASSSYDLCADCRICDLAEKMLTSQLKKNRY